MMDPGLTAASHGLLSIKKEVGRNGVIWWWTNDPKGMGLPNIWTPSRTKPHSKLINDDIHHNMHSGTQQRHFFSARSMFRNRSQSHMHSARTSRLAPQAATTNTHHRLQSTSVIMPHTRHRLRLQPRAPGCDYKHAPQPA